MLSIKSLKVGFVTVAALSSVLLATEASAVTVNSPLNQAAIFLDKTALATLKGAGNLPSADANGSRYIYLNNFYTDSQFIYPPSGFSIDCNFPHAATILCNDTPTNPQGLIAGSYPASHIKSLPAVASLTAAPTYQTGNVVSNWNNTVSGGVIGLAGAFKVRSDFQNPTLSIRWAKLALVNTTLGNPGTWFISDEYGTLWELYNVTKTILPVAVPPSKKTLILTGNLKFGNSDWAGFLSGGTLQLTAAEAQKKIGTIAVTFQY